MDYKKDAEKVLKHWLSKEKLIGIKTCDVVKKNVDRVAKRLKDGYTVEQLIEAIDNYASLFLDEHLGFFYYQYKHRPYDFFRKGDRKSAPFENFLSESKPLYNFAHKKYKELFV